jgi:hypothetical protein
MWCLIRVKSCQEIKDNHNGELYNWVPEMDKFFKSTIVAEKHGTNFVTRDCKWHLCGSDVDVILRDIDPDNYGDDLHSQRYDEPAIYPGKIQWVPATSAILGGSFSNRTPSPCVSSSPISKNKLLLCL